MRVAVAVALAVVMAVSVAEAQRRFRGGFGSEAGAPPKFPEVSDFDGSWHFCRLMYRQVRSHQRGMRWLTPDRLSTLRSARAWKAISSTTSRT